MAGFFIPDPRFEMPELFEPGRKPVGPVEIGWINTLAKGLDFFYLAGELKDLANMYGVERLDLPSSGGSDDGDGTGYLLASNEPTGLTCMISNYTFITSTSVSSINCIYGCFNDGFSQGLQMFTNATFDESVSGGDVYFFLRDSSGNAFRGGTNGENLNDGAKHIITLSIKKLASGTEELKIWADGASLSVLTGTNTLGNSATTWDYPPAILGRNSRGTIDNISTATLDLFMINSGFIFTDEEIKRLHALPYQLLIPK